MSELYAPHEFRPRILHHWQPDRIRHVLYLSVGRDMAGSEDHRVTVIFSAFFKRHLCAMRSSDIVDSPAGDGYLLMTGLEHSHLLACFALSYVSSYRRDAHRYARARGLGELADDPTLLARMPHARIAICDATEAEIMLVRRRHYGGEGIRRTLRATKLCEPDEILVSESVRRSLNRDFVVDEHDVVSTRAWPGVPWEKPAALHRLRGLQPSPGAEADNPEPFLHTLSTMALHEAAIEAAAALTSRPVVDTVELPENGQPMDVPTGAPRPMSSLSWIGIGYDLRSQSHALEVAEAMRSRGVPLDHIIYDTLVSQAGDFVTARRLLDELKSAGARPGDGAYNGLLEKAGDVAAARGVLREMRDAGVELSQFAFRQVLEKAGDLATLGELLGDMREAGLTLNDYLFRALLKTGKRLTTSLGLLGAMRGAGLMDGWVFFEFLRNSADLADARAILQEMRNSSVRPDASSFHNLLHFAEDLASARDLLHLMRENGVLPDSGILNLLLVKTGDLVTVLGLIEELRDTGARPSYDGLKTLLATAKDFASARTIIDALYESGVTLDQDTFREAFHKPLGNIAVCDLIGWYENKDSEYKPHALG